MRSVEIKNIYVCMSKFKSNGYSENKKKTYATSFFFYE